MIPPMVSGLVTEELKRRLGMVVTMTVALALWLWIGAGIQVHQALRPSAALDYWLAKIQIGHSPRQVGDVSQWLRAHQYLMTLVAFAGGVIANGSALRRTLLRSGGAAVVARPCLILAAESLGLHATVMRALWGFLLFPALAAILALTHSAKSFTLGTVIDGLKVNVVHFFGVLLAPSVVLWLFEPYSSGLGPPPANDAKVVDLDTSRAATPPRRPEAIP